MASLAGKAKNRIASQRLGGALSQRYGSKQATVTGTVAGRNLVSVGGRLVYAAGLDGYAPGDAVTLTNAGTPGMAQYTTAGNNMAVQIVAGSGGSAGGGGVTDHGLLSGLGDDDHSQYLTTGRGDDRYYTETEVDAWRLAHLVPNAHHNRQHGILDGSDHTVTGSAGQVIGLTGANALGLLTPLADVTGATKEAILKSTAAGELALMGMRIGAGSGAMVFSGSGNIASAPDIQFSGNAFLATEGNLYVSLDSDNNASAAALIVGHGSPTTSGFVESLRLVDTGVLQLNTAAAAVTTTAGSGYDLLIAPDNRTLFANDKQIRSQTHTAGFLGAGFSISWPLSGKAHLDIRSIYAEELEVTAFQADVMRVRVAEDFLSQSMGFTAAAFTTPAIGSSVRVYFENNPAFAGQIFLNNEWVMFQVIERGSGLLVKQVWGQVSSYLDEGGDRQSWLFTMRSGPVGLRVNTSTTALSFGASGAGYIHHSVLRSANGPWTRYASWSGANPYTPANRSIHAQAGNLNGLVDISTNRYGIAAGNNLGLTPTSGFSGFVADSSGGLRVFNTEIGTWLDGVQTGRWLPSGQLDIGFDGLDVINNRDFTVHSTRYIRLGRAATNAPNLFYSQADGYVALRSGTTDKIRFNDDGSSYFAGVMTIGSSGEIRQGTGTLGSDYTGLRLWRDGNVGRIGGYKSNTLQWYGDTLGEFRAATGLLSLAADGMGLARYETTFGVPIAGTESRAAVAWWDDINARTGSPLARIYAARSDAGTGAYPTLSIEVDPANANANLRPSVWLIGNRAGFAPTLWLGNIYNVVGLPGIYPSRNATTMADTVQFSGKLYFEAHLLRDPANANLDVGTVGNPFRAIYVDQVIASTISGTSMAGQEWEYAGSMQIDAANASNTTLTVTNSGAGRADLDVDRNITLGGTVDGVDVAAFYTAYGTHNHDGLYVPLARTITAGNGLTGGGALSANRTLTVGAGDGITVGATTVGLTTPGSLSVSSTNSASGSHTHAITTSSNPGAAASILATTAAGALTLASLTVPATGYLYLDGTLDFGADTIYEDATYLQVTGTKPLAIGGAVRIFPGGNAGSTPDILLTGNAVIATESSLYINVDSTNNGSGALYFARGADTTAATVLARLTNTGRFGIGVNPAYDLDVAGTARASTSVLTPLLSTASGDLTVQPVGPSVFLADGKGLRTAVFESGFAGSGFLLDQGVTTAGKTTLTIDDLTVRGRMSVYEMLIRQIRASNGAVFVSSTGRVKRVAAISGGYRLYTTEAGETPTATTDHAHGFLPGDLLRAQRTRWNGSVLTDIYRCDLRVTAVDDLYTFRAVLVAGDVPAPGMEFVRIGNNGTTANRQGSIYMTSDDDNAPFIDVVDGVAAHSDWNTSGKIKARLGKLNGITDATFGALSGYGLYSENAYLKGKVVATSGYIGSDTNGWTINSTSIYNDYVRLYSNGQTSVSARIEVGDYNNASTGLIGNIGLRGADGTTAAVGMWAGRNYANRSSAPFRLTLGGDLYAASADIAGKVTATSGAIGGWTVASGLISSNGIRLCSGTVYEARLEVGDGTTDAKTAGVVGDDGTGASPAFWAGKTAAYRGTAPYRVYHNGDTYINNLTAAGNGTIGDITLGGGNTYITAPTAYGLATKGYKFRYGTDIAAGLTTYYASGAGAAYMFLDNNTDAESSSAKLAVSAATSIRAMASGAGKTSQVALIAFHASAGSNVANISLLNDGTNRTVDVSSTAFTSNGNTIWHAGNDGHKSDGSGPDADLLDGNHASVFALKSGATFTGAVTFSGAIQVGNLIKFTSYFTADNEPDYPEVGTAIIYLVATGSNGIVLKARTRNRNNSATAQATIVSA